MHILKNSFAPPIKNGTYALLRQYQSTSYCNETQLKEYDYDTYVYMVDIWLNVFGYMSDDGLGAILENHFSFNNSFNLIPFRAV